MNALNAVKALLQDKKISAVCRSVQLVPERSNDDLLKQLSQDTPAVWLSFLKAEISPEFTAKLVFEVMVVTRDNSLESTGGMIGLFDLTDAVIAVLNRGSKDGFSFLVSGATALRGESFAQNGLAVNSVIVTTVSKHDSAVNLDKLEGFAVKLEDPITPNPEVENA